MTDKKQIVDTATKFIFLFRNIFPDHTKLPEATQIMLTHKDGLEELFFKFHVFVSTNNLCTCKVEKRKINFSPEFIEELYNIVASTKELLPKSTPQHLVRVYLYKNYEQLTGDYLDKLHQWVAQHGL